MLVISSEHGTLLSFDDIGSLETLIKKLEKLKDKAASKGYEMPFLYTPHCETTPDNVLQLDVLRLTQKLTVSR